MSQDPFFAASRESDLRPIETTGAKGNPRRPANRTEAADMNSRHSGLMILLAATAQLAAASVAVADEGRQGDIEYYGLAGYRTGSDGYVKNYANVRYDLDHLWTWGAGGAYFFSDQLSIATELSYGYSNLHLSDSRAPGGPSFTQTADFFSGNFDLEFTPFPTPLSPVVAAGIGFQNVQTAIPGASPQVYCAPGVVYWWCATGVPTYSQTAFTYNVGIGGRLDLSRTIFLKLMYSSTWADYSGLGTRRFDQVTLQIGGRFRYRQ
jgi:opacity protein-like surface antigen